MKLTWIAAMAVLVTTTAQAQVATEKHLTDAMTAVADYKRIDEFDEGPNKKLLAGQSFSLRIPLRKYGSRDSSFVYDYDIQNHTLTLNLNAEPYIAHVRGKTVFWRGFTIGRVVDRGENFEAANRFGASVTVDTARTTTFIVGPPKPRSAPT